MVDGIRHGGRAVGSRRQINFLALLLRLQANLEKDPAKQQALLREADALRDKAIELRKQKAAGVS